MPTHQPIRRGVQHQLTLDDDADQLLRVMATGPKGKGAMLSELIRKEAREREARPALIRKLRAKGGAGQEKT